jgi:hypothetical protein
MDDQTVRGRGQCKQEEIKPHLSFEAATATMGSTSHSTPTRWRLPGFDAQIKTDGLRP